MSKKVSTLAGNKLIAQFMGWYIRNPKENNGDEIVEVYDTDIKYFCEGFGESQNKKFKSKKVISLFGEKRIRKYVNWTETKNMKFHKSWNWLMEVVDNIDNLPPIESSYMGKPYRVEICREHTKILIGKRLYVRKDKGSNRLSNTWQAVIEFIDWYNTEISKKK